MSGTSADGVDAVVATFEDERWFGVVGHAHRAYPGNLRQALLEVCTDQHPITLERLTWLDVRIAERFAAAAKAAIKAAGLQPKHIHAVGSHGQTVFHQPRGAAATTLQLGDPNRIAAACGLPVVADFRRIDMAFGGQGAPLAPALHHALFSKPGERRGVVNIGGIANITVLPGDGSAVAGYDTGPGNGLMDEWTQRHLGRRYDRGGALAARGQPSPPLLAALTGDPYFRRRPPKSSGREYFNLRWAEQRFPQLAGLAAEDVQRSFCELTATTVATALRRANAQRALICGGGSRNPMLMRRLSQLSRCPVEPTDLHGLDAMQVEGAAFAWLAMRRLRGLAGNLPSVTGAARPLVLGGLYQPFR